MEVEEAVVTQTRDENRGNGMKANIAENRLIRNSQIITSFDTFCVIREFALCIHSVGAIK